MKLNLSPKAIEVLTILEGAAKADIGAITRDIILEVNLARVELGLTEVKLTLDDITRLTS